MKKFSKIVAMAALVAMVAAPAMAIPLPPLPAPVPVAGQSDLTSFVVGVGDPGGLITVDWMVVDGTLISPNYVDTYAYLFQIENPDGNPTDVNAFTVSFDTAGVVAAGVLPADDLDLLTASHPAHDVGTFANLAGESEGFALTPLTGVSSLINLDGITWTFGSLFAGEESDTLFFVDPRPPVYGHAVAQDSTPPSPWGSLAKGGQDVPVPQAIPDFGSTMLLLGMAVTAMGFVGRKLDKTA